MLWACKREILWKLSLLKEFKFQLQKVKNVLENSDWGPVFLWISALSKILKNINQNENSSDVWRDRATRNMKRMADFSQASNAKEKMTW